MQHVRSEGASSRVSLITRIFGLVLTALLLGTSVFFFVLWNRYIVTAYLISFLVCALGVIAALVLQFLVKKPNITRWIPVSQIIVILVAIVCGLLAWPFSSKNPAYYDQQMKYLESKRYTAQYFPDTIPEYASDYYFAFSPEYVEESQIILQFSCSRKDIRVWQNLARKNAIVSPMTLSQAQAIELDPDIQDEIADFLGQELPENEYYHLKIKFPPNLEKHPNVKVYVLSSNFNYKDSHTEVIFIDLDQDWICFLKQN